MVAKQLVKKPWKNSKKYIGLYVTPEFKALCKQYIPKNTLSALIVDLLTTEINRIKETTENVTH